jgi:pimeloyl-ACP methyl ester carboxylesterase
MAEMARGVLEAAPERFALAGLSMGGYVSLEVVRRAPERVEALALLDTSARPDTPEQTEARLALVELARGGRFDEVWQGLLPKVVHPDRVDEPGIRSVVREMAHTVGPEGFERQERAIIAARTAAPTCRPSPAPPSSCTDARTPSRPRTCTRS